MIPAAEVVDLSRLQFALTALYHFLFVPLTLGLSVMLAIMETVYVMTGRDLWKKMVKYWGVLFGINFVLGVATGLTMEFQFGTNWAYYSHYVGDVFGAPLAIEGLMAFFLEATFVGLFFFGWNRLSKLQHLTSTWLLALGTNLSALWILIANGWMQHPVGAYFDYQTMRMEVSSFYEMLFNPVAQAKFVHTISAGYVTGAMFVLSISAYFLLRGRNKAFAKRSMTVAVSFGLASALSVVVLGDESGYVANENQKMKLATMEAMWHTEKAPANLTVFGIPDEKTLTTKYAIDIPYALGIIATRSFNTPLQGIIELIEEGKLKIKDGMIAYDALKVLQKDPKNEQAKAVFTKHSENLGYALLLKKYTENVTDATEEQINQAAHDLKPKVLPMFFSFRIMVACGIYFILLFATGFYLSVRHRLEKTTWYHRIAFYSLPLPWVAAELGWIVAEYGRQPWVVEGILPTFMGASSLTSGQVMTSIAGFVLFYTVLAIVEIYLMVKYIRLGPDGMNHH
ncbi:TPA: cytochrome bd-I ubiquinol oxidase subunit CydA [Legionella pneumophila subsp. pneumophila]|uniref:Cytochrome bd-I ubiquinol oxidase subunit CydA n=2 Tax=Legionella pneumophila TaxID=446 RepID=A0A4V4R884_LEGPN|nr:cytochrome ubiquinol oxidase subunit I [Legionella pneumophila]AMV13984.1 Cytochrome bd-I ubiquinol oxidase subunit 1 [Legionella pneumophila]ANN92246.1 cytochrome d terminal oxidase subunit 1 [Legionella pneumophila]AOW52194.1 cytochrome d terminal oxidase subunit 1 [Legionella pneumophila subsp. pneumophila]AOW54217.1 cytochrome d terminal oxidase subunit 1 [Legionella pneumophila subsp. pneumophila]AOW57492.1 cytochrome d terminal oxidase subunit 1 [Legionella pneumophila subsp. pneumoph